jgi:nicotinamide riboside kinase
MKVYFIGSHSTGKTTMARYVSKKYGLPLLNEISRTVMAEMEIPMEALRADMETVDTYQKNIFKRQIDAEEGRDDFVSDRSFCNLAYACNHANVFKELFEDPRLHQYVDGLRENDVVMFFIRPCRETMVNDGMRERVEWDGIVRIDAMVKMMLEMWGLRYFQVSTPSMQERVRLVDAVMSISVSIP